MSHIVQSLENAVEAGVKGIISLAEGYMSPPDTGTSSGTASTESVSSGSPPEAHPIAIASAPATMAAPSPSEAPAVRSHPTLASRLAPKDPIVQVTDVPSGWIHLQSTYLDSAGGQRRVRSFGLRNVSASPADVEVASDLEDQVFFWSLDDLEVSSMASSQSASSMSTIGTPDLKLTLDPGHFLTVYLAFRPSRSTPSSPGSLSGPSSDGGFTPRIAAVSASDEMSPVLSGRLPSATTSGGTSLISDTTALSSSNISHGSSNPRRADPVHRSFSVHASVLIHATTQVLDTALEPPASQDIAIPFFATVCRSLFSLGAIDPSSGLTIGQQMSNGSLTIDFGTDNAVGTEVHRDMLLVNRSEIDLVWSTKVINAPDKDSIWFSMRDLDSENVFGVDSSAEPVPLPALSSRHLRLTLRATATVADFDFEFVVSNVNQKGNSVTCHAVGSYHCAASDDSLRILSGSTLDYGQIIDGSWAKKLISAKNAGDRAIDVHYSASPGYEVVFRLAGVAGEDIDEDVPSRPVADKRPNALSRTSTRDGHRTRDASVGASGSMHESKEDWFARDRDEESATSSRPLSRVTSRGSSHMPSRTDATSDEDEDAPPPRSTTDSQNFRASDNLGDRDIPNQIEELTMRPGTEYRVFAMYRPARDLINPPEIAGALRPSTFKVFLDSAPASQRSRPAAARSRKVIHATAESCTSLIAIPSGHLIDFGEVTVGASKSTTIAVQNLSALSARVEIAAISKVLNTNRTMLVIPPFETVNERLDFFPRRINDRYEKQVFVRNHLNKANNQLIQIKSKNVDKYNVTLHSHLYKILTPGGSNFIDFGSVVINSPSVRTVQFQNLTNEPLVLDLSASQPEDVELYIKQSDLPCTPYKKTSAKYAPQPDYDRQAGGNLKERFVESLQDKDQKEGETKAPSRTKHRDKHVKRPHKDEEKPSHHSLVGALRKGGRGRPVQLYRNAVVFKDRGLLDDAEYLDLAVGPPTAAHRQPAGSKKAHVLDTIAQEDKATLSGQHPKLLKLDFAASAKSSGLVGKDKVKKIKTGSSVKPDRPATPTRPNVAASTEATPVTPSASILRAPALKQESSPDSKSPALTGRRAELKTDPAAVDDVTKLSPEELLVAIEQHETKRSASAVSHFSPEQEEQYVRRLIALRKELQNHVSSGQFVPARVLTVPPNSSRQVIVVMTPNGSTRPHVTTRAKRAESRIFITLLEYDRKHLVSVMGSSAELSEMPIRDLVIRSSCVRSVLEVQQSSINFGTIERGEVKSRTIVIHNLSDCVGVFRMRTSGSIASSNLKLGLGRYGVVSAFGRKEVASFSFTPNMVGNYQETIVVENVLDSFNDQNVLVKATVRKMPAFSLDVTKLHMAPTQAGAWPGTASFVLTNTSKTERSFVVEVGDEIAESAFAEPSLSRDEKDAGMALSVGEEEEVEGLLQKLKIARRKNKPDKIAKYEKRLGELGVTTAPAEDAPAEDEPASGAVTPATREAPTTRSITIPLGPNKKAKILVALTPRTGEEDLNACIKVFERKNTDETVTIDVTATPQYTEEPAPVPSPSEPEDPLNLAIMRHCLELTLLCPVSPTAFCVGSTLFLPVSSPLYDRISNDFPIFPHPLTGKPAGLLLADGYSRQIPGNTHAEANALANFREKYDAADPSPEAILAEAACYATMEPCSVRTSGGPSCALELVRAHVKTVYLGVEEPPDFVQCEGVRILEQGGVEVRRVVGLEEECLSAARRGRS